MILWDGERFFHEPNVAKARKLIAEGKAQDSSKEDGFSLKYRHQFPQYQTREMRAEPVRNDPPPPPQTEEPPTPTALNSAVEPDWEAHREEYKEATGALRARKDSVIGWMKSEGKI